MVSVIASFLGGMGLFFMGLTLTGDSVKKIAGRRFRDLFLRWTRGRLGGAGLGVASGLVFQSTSAVSLLLASLIGAGATTVERALPVMLGANAGVAFLVILAVVDIRIAVLFLLGLSGLVISFGKPAKYVHVAGILFGVGLLLFGLGIVRVGAAPLAEADWFRQFLASQGLPLPVYFLIGALACLLLQSSAGVSILAITLAASGIMDGDDALITIFGSLFGSSCLSRFYAIQLSGARKRLVMGQVLFNPVGLLLFLPPVLLEHYAHVPLLLEPTAGFFPDLPTQLTAINIAFDVVTSVVLLCLTTPFGRLLERLCPDAPDSLQALAYAKGLTGVSPETALVLIDKEQVRLVGHLPAYTAAARQALEKEAVPFVRDLHASANDLLTEIDGCLLDMVMENQAAPNANTLALLQGMQSLLRSLNDTLHDLVSELGVSCQTEAMRRLRQAFLEALETILLQARDVFTCATQDEWELLSRLVADKGPVMERLRERYVSETTALPPTEHWQLMRITGLYERSLWLLRHLGRQQRKFLTEIEASPAAQACAGIPASDLS